MHTQETTIKRNKNGEKFFSAYIQDPKTYVYILSAIQASAKYAGYDWDTAYFTWTAMSQKIPTGVSRTLCFLVADSPVRSPQKLFMLIMQ